MNKRCLHISCWGALITLFLLSSCKMDMTELCDDHTHTTNMQVTFDWQLSPEATAKGMAVYFYNLDKPGNDPIRYDFAGMEGGTLKLTPGTWQAIAFNNDTETILLRGTESIHTMEAYTRQSSIEEGTMLTRSLASARSASPSATCPTCNTPVSLVVQSLIWLPRYSWHQDSRVPEG